MTKFKPLVTAALLTVISQSAIAALAPESGFSGELSLSNARIGDKSNFVASSDPKISSAEEAYDEFWMPLGMVKYTYGANLDKEWFIGTSRNDIAVGMFVLEGGYRQQLQDGSIWSVSYLPTVIGEPIWKNPYVGAEQLEETEAKGQAYRLQIENIAGTLLTLDMAYGSREVNAESSAANLSSQLSNQYDRNSDLYYLKGSYSVEVSQHWALFPSLIYLLDDAKGEAMNNQGAGGELTALFNYDSHSIAATMSYMNHEFSGHNAIFEQSGRIDDKYSAFLAYEYLSLWNIDSLSLISLSGYNATDSSIAFYDSADWITSIGMNFAF
ncbi:DUF2860 family protein [Vibrio sp. 10N]|uniref:DUF2860 family protein n=1 Tax=Vibrio sp. 10N TaxID=3058938 RepID=UPI0028147A5B|nr:DUF2860 domain-containing protein [Vibrio sp. 10N]